MHQKRFGAERITSRSGRVVVHAEIDTQNKVYDVPPSYYFA